MTIPRFIFDAIGDISAKQKMTQTLKGTQPTISQQDKDRGVKLRYFARLQSQRNSSIVELSGGDYNSISSNPLFLKTQINWIIKGKLEDTVLTFRDGTSILVKGVISQNQALLALASKELPEITQYLQNHMEFWAGE